MTRHFERQIDRLKAMIVALGQRVEQSVQKAIRAVELRDAALALIVIEEDDIVDTMEIDVEEECLHTLALHQPVALDLRYVVAVLKINNDLERIADHASNIARQVQMLADEPPVPATPYDLRGMSERVLQMINQAMKALIHTDAEIAQEVRLADDKVDAIHRRMYQQVADAIQENPQRTPQLIQLMNVSRQLERIADLCVNIAEDVIYMARGEIARHREAQAADRPPSGATAGA